MRWFFPSTHGDFRLSANTDGTSLLAVHDPTPAEMNRLGKLLVEARTKGWISAAEGICPVGTTVLTLRATITETGPVLAGITAKDRGMLTVLESKKDELVEVYEGSAGALAIPETTLAKVETAVTIEKPHGGAKSRGDCPESLASEVLHAFCTPKQWTDWERTGTLVAFGHRTGHAYRLAHRKREVAARQGRVAYDLDDEVPVHAYLWSVPPPEEVLAMKLCVEHRESWVRNENTMDRGLGTRSIFHDPFLGDGGARDQITLETMRIAFTPTLQMLGKLREKGLA